MKKIISFATITLAAMVFVGCEKKSDTEKAADSASDKMGAAADKAKDMGNAAADKAKDMGNAATDKAKALIDQGMQYVKDNKLDLAQKTLDQLDALKSQLPAEWAAKVDQLRSAINATKGGGGMTAPGK